MSKDILRILSLAKRNRQNPSDILGIEDEYAAFCFDEACSLIMYELEKEKAPQPRWTKEEKKPQPRWTKEEKKPKMNMLDFLLDFERKNAQR